MRAGWLVTAGAAGYVVVELIRYPVWRATALPAADVAAQLALGAAAYGASTILLALAWWVIVRAVQPDTISAVQGVRIFGVSQLAKYLPTNVLHLVGRYAMCRSAGLSPGVVVLSTGLETLAIAAVAVLFGAQAGIARFAGYETWAAELLAVGALVAALAPVAYVIARRALASAPLMRPLPRVAWRHLQLSWLCALLFFAVFFAVSADINVRIAAMASDTPIGFGFALAMVCVAWLAGTFTPGAPGGLGVREAVLILGYSTVLDPYDAVFVAVCYRVATVAGDLVLFAAASGLPAADSSVTAN